MEVLLKEDEILDDLQFNNFRIIQNKNGFKFGMDAVLLSDFAKDIKNGSKVIDLGTGTGIIGILLCGKTNLSKIIGVEVQPSVADMAKRSIILNNIQNKFEIVNEDVKNITNKFEKESFDVVVSNPPYKKKNTGLLNNNEKEIISRHETTANLEDFIFASSILLKKSGCFYMVHRPQRLGDIICLLRKYKIEPKIMRFVYPNVEKQANMVLIKAVKGANEFLKVEKPLIVYNKDNNYTKEILKIYNKI